MNEIVKLVIGCTHTNGAQPYETAGGENHAQLHVDRSINTPVNTGRHA
jgi:hypothetical protein